MLTEHTITDEQIRAFGDAAAAANNHEHVRIAGVALQPITGWYAADRNRENSRWCIARILNAHEQHGVTP